MAETTIVASVLVPYVITPAMLQPGTSVPEIDASLGELAWTPNTAYVVGDERVDGDLIYYCTRDHASRIQRPSVDGGYWLKRRPTNRMRAFSKKQHEKTTANGELVIVLRPGIVTGLALSGLVGEQLEVQVVDATTGGTKKTYTVPLFEQAAGLFEYLFMPLRPMTKWQTDDLPWLGNMELHIRVTSSSGVVAIGMLAVGHWQTMLGSRPDKGGVEWDAEAEIKSFSSIKEDIDGNVDVVLRPSTINVACTVLLHSSQANAATDLLLAIAGTPVFFVVLGLPEYAYLNGFGLVSGSVRPSSAVRAIAALRFRSYV